MCSGMPSSLKGRPRLPSPWLLAELSAISYVQNLQFHAIAYTLCMYAIVILINAHALLTVYLIIHFPIIEYLPLNTGT